MSLRTTEENLSGNCPVCEEATFFPEGVEEAEVLTCHDCQSQLVVESIEGNITAKISLSQDNAPTFSSKNFDKPLLYEFLHKYRPLGLQKEDTHFNKVANIIQRKII